jgi:arsenate reductase (glutaredoxin)
MKKIYHLSSCSTCQKILKEVNPGNEVELIDIKQHNITAEDLDFCKERTGSYEALFSKRAMKFRSLGFHEMELSGNDYRKYILEEYTFLKRPVAIIGNEIYAGNSKKVVESLKEALKY